MLTDLSQHLTSLRVESLVLVTSLSSIQLRILISSLAHVVREFLNVDTVTLALSI